MRQLTRFRLTRRVARSLCIGRASCAKCSFVTVHAGTAHTGTFSTSTNARRVHSASTTCAYRYNFLFFFFRWSPLQQFNNIARGPFEAAYQSCYFQRLIADLYPTRRSKVSLCKRMPHSTNLYAPRPETALNSAAIRPSVRLFVCLSVP